MLELWHTKSIRSQNYDVKIMKTKSHNFDFNLISIYDFLGLFNLDLSHNDIQSQNYEKS